MTDQNPNPPATVPPQREAVGPVKKSTPVIIALVVIVGLIGLANISSLVSGKKRTAPQSALPMRPATCKSTAGLQLRDAAGDRGEARFRGSAAETGASRRDAAAPGCAKCARAGGGRSTAYDCRPAFRHVWRQPERTGQDIQCLASTSRGETEGTGEREAASRSAQQRYRRHRLRSSDDAAPPPQVRPQLNPPPYWANVRR